MEGREVSYSMRGKLTKLKKRARVQEIVIDTEKAEPLLWCTAARSFLCVRNKQIFKLALDIPVPCVVYYRRK